MSDMHFRSMQACYYWKYACYSYVYFRFTVSAVYYGLTIAAGEVGTNRYSSVIFSALAEIPANIIITVIMNLPQ